jgi:hypothetical protein
MKKVDTTKFVKPKKLNVTSKAYSAQMYGVKIC